MDEQELILDDPAAPDTHWGNFTVQRNIDEVAALVKLIDGRGYISGSYAAWVLSMSAQLEPNDIDIFATTEENVTAIANALRAFYPNAYQAGQTEIAITVSRGIFGERSFQIIKPNPVWKEFPADILKSFDMNICRAVILDEKHGLGDLHIGLVSAKILRTANPLRSLRRVLKYSERGITFSDHELLKLFQAWLMTSNEKRAEMLEKAKTAAFPVVENAEYPDSGDWDYDDDDDDWWEGE